MIKKLFLVFILTLSLSAKVDEKDDKLLRLSFDVMLYNKDLNNAYKIATKAADLYKSEYWLQKSAVLSIWTQKPDKAKDYYKKLYKVTNDKNYLEKLLNLSKATHDKKSELKFLEKSFLNKYDKEVLKQLTKLYNDLGYLKHGVAFLEKQYQNNPKKELLKQSILLQYNYKNYNDVLKSLKDYSKKYGTDEELLTIQTKILFSQKKYQKAYDRLKNHKIKDKKLHALFTNIVYILQKEDTLYKVLQQKEPLELAKFNQLTKLAKQRDTKTYLKLTQKQFDKEKSVSNFYKLVYAQNNPNKVSTIIKNLDKTLLKKVQKDANFWLLYAQDKPEFDAKIYYKKALKLSPNSKEVHAAYLWSLISTSDKKALKKELEFTQKTFPKQRSFYLPLALGYLSLEKSPQAKRYLDTLLVENPKDWKLHLLVSDMYNLYKNTDAANTHLLKAWILCQQDENSKNDKNSYFDYLRLALYFDRLNAPKYLHEAKGKISKENIANLQIGMLMQMDALEKIKLIKEKNHINKDWLELFIALKSEDLKSIKKLTDSSDKLPINDKITALFKTKQNKKATKELKKAIKNNPDNNTLKIKLIQNTISKKSTFELSSQQIDRGSLKYNQTDVDIKMYDNDTLGAYIQANTSHGLKQNDKQLLLELYTSFKKTKLQFKAGIRERKEVDKLYEFGIEHSHKRWLLNSTFSYNKKESTTNYLLLHGKKDSIDINLNYQATKRDNILANYRYNKFKDNNKTLGFSNFYELSYTHTIRFGYPDIYYKLFTSLEWETRYYKELLPKGYWQTGLNFGVGNSAKSRFSGGLKPYFDTTVLYNNNSHVGYSLNIGIGKKVYKKDRLLINATYASGISNRFQEDYFSLGVVYRYW